MVFRELIHPIHPLTHGTCMEMLMEECKIQVVCGWAVFYLVQNRDTEHKLTSVS